jgi:hypothetical protein
MRDVVVWLNTAGSEPRFDNLENHEEQASQVAM